MKRLRLLSQVLALMVVLAILFTACGNSVNNSSSQKKVNLTFAWWGEKARHDATNAAIALWNKENPNIHVTGQISGWEGYHEKLFTQFAGNNAPDLFQVSFNRFEEFARNGSLLDLTPYKDSDFSGIDAGTWSNMYVDSKIYGVASGINGSAQVYNVTKVKKYGLKPLTGNEDINDYYNLAKAATMDTNGDGKIDQWGVFDPMDADPATYDKYVKPFGLSVWTNNMTGCDFNNPAIINILKGYERFRKDKVIVPPEVTILDGQSYMGLGVIVYDGTSISGFPTGITQTTDQLALTMPLKPADGGKDLRSTNGDLPISIYSKTKYPKEAVEFLSWFLTSPEAAEAMGGMQRGIFPSEAQRKVEEPKYTDVEKQIVKVVDQINALNNPVEKIQVPLNYQQILDICTQEKNRYLLDQITLQQFMDNLQKAADTVFAQNQ